MQKIGQGVIAAYMAHLHEVVTEREEFDNFAFLDPAATYNCERSDFGSYLVNRLKEGKTDRIFFMPYNPGEHWILTIIWEDDIYILDPLGKSVHYQAWENSVINAVKSFNAETDRANKVPKLKLLPWAAKTRKGYTQQQLDEVRIEVADYLQTLL
ncbi:uncharacterized protein LOC121049788 [Rosa chinensis]|uniref:uncharacterized protein LOC121049788 n=1 Tax=Rosa chinensis TaxID=74649 RepID=UPI001AD8DC2F|nr:uncharacterized protein LOC121049788 [Rosa chinensis]